MNNGVRNQTGRRFLHFVRKTALFSAQSVIQFCNLVSYHIVKKTQGSVAKMNPRQRMLTIRLTEKLAKNPGYTRTIGVEIVNQKEKTSNNKISEVQP